MGNGMTRRWVDEGPSSHARGFNCSCHDHRAQTRSWSISTIQTAATMPAPPHSCACFRTRDVDDRSEAFMLGSAH